MLNKGYEDSDLPTNQTIWNKLHSLGYKRKKVAKTKPIKKIKEADAIFEELDKTNKQADASEGKLRVSFDAKNRVNIGDFSRGGKN